MNKIRILSVVLVMTLITGVFSACSEEKAPDTKQESGPEIIYDGGNYVYTVVDKNGEPVSKEIRDGVADYIKRFILSYFNETLISPVGNSDILVGIHGHYDKEMVIRGYEAYGTLNFRDPEGNIRIDYTSIKNAEVLIDENTNEPYIAVYFTDEGKTAFEALTEELSRKPDGENILGIYVGDDLFSSPKITSPLSGGVAYITSELFLDTPEQATVFTNAINSEYAKNYTLKYSYEITPTKEEIGQWEKEEKARRKQEFITAIATAMAEQTGEKYYAKDIDNDLMSKYTSFISTLKMDLSSVEDPTTQFGTYRPVIILGTPEYTKQYITDIENSYDTSVPPVESSPADEYEHLVVEFDFEEVELLELFDSLEVLDISGCYPRSLYTNMHQQYLMYSEHRNESFLESYASISQHYSSIDMTGLTSLKMIPNLDKIKYLSVGYSGISSFDGIEGAKHLEYLEAVGCGLTDIKALSKTTTLKFVDLSSNSLTSLKGIEGNKDLIVGIFNHNQLTSLDALSATAKMTELQIVGNALTNLDGIQGNKGSLVNLYASENVDKAALEEIQNKYEEKYVVIIEDELSEAEREELAYAGRTLEDISALEGFTALKLLSVYGNKIEDISCVATMPALKTLTANDNLISSLPVDMSGAESLGTVELSHNKLTSIDGIGTLKAIVSLDASNNEISDLGDIRNATALITLRLSDNRISDITSIRNLTGLMSLHLANNQISRLISLSRLTVLHTLDLAGNEFESISALGKLESVSEVNLSRNEMLTDISDFDSVFDSATLKKADFSVSSNDEDGEAVNLIIVDWTPIFSFEATTFAGVPQDILAEIGK